MHEASIVLGLLETISHKCTGEGYVSVDSIRIKIGAASGVLPEAVAFAFEAAKTDTIASNATLTIDVVPLGGRCKECGRDFEVHEAYLLNCPCCGSLSFTVTKGYELDIVEMEVQ